MDANRLGRGERIAGISAAILFLIMIFIDWFGAPDVVDAFVPEGIDTGANAFQSFGFIDVILLLTVIAAIAVAVMSMNASSVNLPVAGSALVAGLGILSVVLILYRIVDPPSGADRELGVFLGLIAAGGVAYGGWTAMQEEGTSFSDQADRFGDGGGTGGSSSRGGSSRGGGAGGSGTPPAGGNPPPAGG